MDCLLIDDPSQSFDTSRVELLLKEASANRTRAALTISAPFLAGLRRSLPHKALTRLYALCQTAAEA